MAKQGAPVGNKNAAGGRGGARLGAVGTLVPFGSLGTGLYLGAHGDSRQSKRHTVSSAVGSGVFGALGGATAGPLGMLVAIPAGAAVGAAMGYGASKIGQHIGKKLKKK